LAKNLEKRDNLLLKNTLFDVCFMFGGIRNVPFIYLPVMVKSFFKYKNFCNLLNGKCGAVVECIAGDLGDNGSRHACVIDIFNR
jgi:hypothetical protein